MHHTDTEIVASYVEHGEQIIPTAAALGLTVVDVRRALMRADYRPATSTRAPVDVEPVVVPAPQTPIKKLAPYQIYADGKIMVNRLKGTIATDLGEWGNVEYTLDEHAQMKRRYSNEWEATREQIPEISYDFDLEPLAFARYKSIHGWTHASSPFTVQEWEEGLDPDVAAEMTTMSQERAFQRKLSQRKNKILEDKAAKYDQIDHGVIHPLLAAIGNLGTLYRPPLLVLPASAGRYDVFTACFDTHFGKRGVDGYNREHARLYLLAAVERLVASLAKYGRPDRIITTHGGDFIHVDTFGGTTTAGTRQDTDGTSSEMLREGSELFVEYIDMLRQIPENGVDVLPVYGNHDHLLSSAVQDFAWAWYRESPDVRVRRSDKARQYIVSGQTLIGVSHGDGAKLAALPLLMAQDEKEAWGQTTFREFFTGHLHHEAMKDYQGVRVHTLPSISGTDAWHEREGYQHSVPGLTAYIINHASGLEATLHAPVTLCA